MTASSEDIMEEILFGEVLTDESLVKAHMSISLKNNLYYQEAEAISWYVAKKKILKRLRGCSRDTFLLSDIVDMTRDALSPTRAWFAARELMDRGLIAETGECVGDSSGTRACLLTLTEQGRAAA